MAGVWGRLRVGWGDAGAHLTGERFGSRGMAGGWTRDGAVQDQIDDTVTDAVLAARARMPAGVSETHCVECVT